MKHILTLSLSLLLSVCICNAQDTTANSGSKPPRDFKGNLYLSLFVGSNLFHYGFWEPGIMLNRKAAARHHVAGKAAYAAVEFSLRRFNTRYGGDQVYGPKAGIWLSAPTSGLGIGACVINYVNVSESLSAIAFRPEAGLAMGHFTVTYGYNFLPTKNYIIGVNAHLIALKLIIGVAHLNR